MHRNKKLQGSIIYLVYMALCHAANYVAITAKEAWRFERNVTFEAYPYYTKTIVAFVILGLIWAAERFVADRAGKAAVIVIRIISIAMLMWMNIAWFFGDDIGFANAAGMEPILAMEIGWLLYGILELLLKKDKRTNEI